MVAKEAGKQEVARSRLAEVKIIDREERGSLWLPQRQVCMRSQGQDWLTRCGGKKMTGSLWVFGCYRGKQARAHKVKVK